MAMYNLIEYSGDCLKTFGSLWQYYRDKTIMTILLIFLMILIVFHLNINKK